MGTGTAGRRPGDRRGSRTLIASGLVALVLPSAAAAQDDGQPVVLDPVTVEGDPGVVTEDTGSYTTGSATVGYKQPVDLRDVPQSITVITRERLDDANANSLEEAANLIPNVTEATGNLFSGSLYARGHEVFTYNVDGAPRPFLSLYGTAPDMVFFDRVEVLSGPSGVFQGSGEPVGTINLVRKRPKRSFGAQAAGEVGTYDSYRGEVDVTAPFTEDGGVRGRAIGFAETQDSFVDFVEQDSGGGYGTMEVDIGDATTLSVGGIAEGEETVSFSGLPTYTDGGLIDVSRDTYIGADWNSRELRSVEGFAELEHEFDFGGVFKLTSRTYDRTADIKALLGSTGVDRSTGTFDAFTFAREFEEQTSYVDANMTAPFTFLGRSSEVTFGADYRFTDQQTRQNFDFSAGTQNFFGFDPTAIPEPTITYPGVGPGFRLNTETETDEVGLYGYSRLQVLDGLNLTLGGRFAMYDSETRDTGRGVTTSEISENRFVPLAGLSYDVTRQVTAYTSYSEIFQPQSEQTASGAQLDPIVGRQVELGGKGSFFGGDLNAQAAVFWLQDKNRAVSDPNTTGAFLAAGEAETTGFETYAAGSPYPGLDLSAGYSFVETDLESDPSPAHSFTTSAKYTFQSGLLQDVYVGGGMRAVSSTDVVSGGVEIEAEGYAVFNALIGYKPVENLDIQLFVNNLFDNEYIQRVNTTARGTFYGEPLSAMLRVSARF